MLSRAKRLVAGILSHFHAAPRTFHAAFSLCAYAIAGKTRWPLRLHMVLNSAGRTLGYTHWHRVVNSGLRTRHGFIDRVNAQRELGYPMRILLISNSLSSNSRKALISDSTKVFRLALPCPSAPHIPVPTVLLVVFWSRFRAPNPQPQASS